MPVNTGLAQVSNDFLLAAVVIYALAMLAFACDFAFGKKPVKAAAAARVPALVGAVPTGPAGDVRPVDVRRCGRAGHGPAVTSGRTGSAGGWPSRWRWSASAWPPTPPGWSCAACRCTGCPGATCTSS